MTTENRFPFPPFPNGWFLVAYSEELPAMAVLPLSYFGRHLVLYRGESGAPHLVDAHCLHLGAHLGHGGTVKGEGIKCPFHGWCFDGSGHCVSVPYSPTAPRAARLRTWNLREIDGAIMAHHHAVGDGPQEEPIGAGRTDQSWTEPRRYRRKIRTHVQEFAENCVDPAHFQCLHNAATLPACETSTDGRVLRSTLRTAHDIRGTLVPATIHVVLHGLGIAITTAHSGGVETMIVTHCTPIDAEHIDLRLQLQVKRLDPEATRAVEAGTFMGVRDNMDRDITIWENKIYRSSPPLCDADRTIGVFRRWAKQFYPPSPAGHHDVIALRRKA